MSDTLEFVGNNTNLPGWEGTLSATLTIFKNLSFYAQADGRGDRIVYNNTDQFRDRQNGGIGGGLGVLGCAYFMPGFDPNCTDAAKEQYMRKFGCVAPCKTDATGATIYWQKENGGRLAVGDVRGDYNEDGVVDAADYVVWRKAFGQLGGVADGNGDAHVDDADYAIWRSHVGRQVQPPASGALAGVPEPSTIVIGALLAASIWSRRHRRRAR